jgi:hypothetical protein
MLREHRIEPTLLWAIDDKTTDLDERVEQFLDHRLAATVAEFRVLVSGNQRTSDDHREPLQTQRSVSSPKR